MKNVIIQLKEVNRMKNYNKRMSELDIKFNNIQKNNKKLKNNNKTSIQKLEKKIESSQKFINKISSILDTNQ